MVLLPCTRVCVRPPSSPASFIHVPSGPKRFGLLSTLFFAGSNLRLVHLGFFSGSPVTVPTPESRGFPRKLSIRSRTSEKLGSFANVRATGPPCCMWGQR